VKASKENWGKKRLVLRGLVTFERRGVVKICNWGIRGAWIPVWKSGRVWNVEKG